MGLPEISKIAQIFPCRIISTLNLPYNSPQKNLEPLERSPILTVADMDQCSGCVTIDSDGQPRTMANWAEEPAGFTLMATGSYSLDYRQLPKPIHFCRLPIISIGLYMKNLQKSWLRASDHSSFTSRPHLASVALICAGDVASR